MKTPDNRCDWPGSDQGMIRYHDEEWGVPTLDDNLLFEYLVLDTFQAGLSWSIIFNKRHSFSIAFDEFDPGVISGYDEGKILTLLNNSEIIRNRLKIVSTIENAKIFLDLQSKYNGFHNYFWNFSDGKSIINQWENIAQIPSRTFLSDRISQSFKKQGFKFTGSIVCYSIMQSAGMVNDHLKSCFRYSEINSLIDQDSRPGNR